VQESKAEKDSQALTSMLSSTALVLREGVKSNIDASKIVVGDVIIINGGDKIPADARIFQGFKDCILFL
jgi:P-type E1-E2 ATPase